MVFEEDKQAFPDCYLRIGNKIFVIEFKDYDIEDKILESYNFTLIKNTLDDKFITKGVNQLSVNSSDIDHPISIQSDQVISV